MSENEIIESVLPMPSGSARVSGSFPAERVDVYTMEDIRDAVRNAIRIEREECAQTIEHVGPKEGSLRLVTDGFAAAVRARD